MNPSSRNSPVEIVPARTAHVGFLARNMRAIDREECEAMGRTPKGSLRRGVMTSDVAWSAMIDGRCHAMFGVVTASALTGEAVPWFLGTDEVYRRGRELLSWGPRFIDRMGDSSMVLRNLVSARNHRAIRLLRRWGFDVGQDEVMVRGMAFLQFEKAMG
ncbi:MAG: hypothetical protein CL804_03435 [Citromicrobium sp.]|nr:hypothetical protein [Citromicrobium sp.]